MNKTIQKNYQGGIKSWLLKQKNKSILRFLTCGSVDDGKSTLIGRILHDTKQIYTDQLSLVTKYSKKHGTTQSGVIDLSLIVDGLQAEREQGITIDVAYKYFSTNNRKFIIVDTPGHEQYTRNMATGASNCDLAILLIDARKGLLNQTKRHSFIITLLGIKYLIVAINKMDLVSYKEDIFNNIKKDFLNLSKKLPKNIEILFIPISALLGINVVSAGIKWYKGQTLLEILETIEIKKSFNNKKLRFPIQYIIRSKSDFRGYAGTLESGELKLGQKIKILPCGIKSKITNIITFDGKLKKAIYGQSINVTLQDDIDISRGDLLIASDDDMVLSQYVSLNIVWMDILPLSIGNKYIGKIAGKKTTLYVEKIHYKIEINTLIKKTVNKISLNGIGLIDISFNEPIAIDLYQDNPVTGGIIFIDPISNITVGAGMIQSIYCTKKNNREFDKFEIEFNELIIRYFPHWGVKKLK